MNKVLLSLCFSLISLIASPAHAAVKAIMEGVPSSNSTIVVSTRTGRVVVTGLHVSSSSNFTGPLTVNGSSLTVVNSVNYSSAAFFNSTAANRAVIIGADALGTGNAFIKAIAPSNNSNTQLDINPNGGGVTLGGTITIGSGGTPLFVISTGTWGPTLANFTNLDSAAIVSSPTYSRIGNIATVFGAFTADATTTLTFTQMTMSLPVASDFTVAEDAGGAGASSAAGAPAVRCYAGAAADAFVLDWTPTATTNQTYNFNCSYVIK